MVNRETKRMMQRQGQGEPGAQVRRDPAQMARQVQNRPTPREFFRGVRSELRKVVWPTRSDVTSYSVVVFVTLVLLLAMIFGLNIAFGYLVNLVLGA